MATQMNGALIFAAAALFALPLATAASATAKPGLCGHQISIGTGEGEHVGRAGVPAWALKQTPGIEPDDAIWQHATCDRATHKVMFHLPGDD